MGRFMRLVSCKLGEEGRNGQMEGEREEGGREEGGREGGRGEGGE